MSAAYHSVIKINSTVVADWFTKIDDLAKNIRFSIKIKAIYAKTRLFEKQVVENVFSDLIEFLTC